MTEIIQLSAAIERVPSPASLGQTPALRTGEIYVIFTTVDDTLAAVRVAARVGRAMGAPLTLIHFRRVPYPLAVDQPAGPSPIETDWFVRRLRAEGIEIRARVFLCRDERRVFPMALRRHSLVVVGGRRSWWPTRAERRRRALEAAGHFVLFVDPVEHGARHAEEKADA